MVKDVGSREHALVPASLLIAVFVGACGDSGTDPAPDPVPAEIRLSPADTAVNDGEQFEFSVVVIDDSGNQMIPPPEVTYSARDDAVLDLEGKVVRSLRPGSTVVLAEAGEALDSSLVTVRQIATEVERVAGHDQAGPAGSQLRDTLVVRLLDRHGDVVPEHTVEFVVAEGGGSVFPESAVTDSLGLARALWTLGTTAGPNALDAQYSLDPDVSVSFSALGYVGEIAQLILVGGGGQVSSPESVLPDSISVKVADIHGNGIEGARVTWAPVFADGAVYPDRSLSDAEGVARASWVVGRRLEDSLRANVDESPDVKVTIHSSVRVEFADVSSGGYHTCSLTTEGLPYCWGENEFGQVGESAPDQCLFDDECALRPLPVSGGHTFDQIEAGDWGTCAVQSETNDLYCWGSIGGIHRYNPVPSRIESGSGFIDIGVGHQSLVCGLTEAGQALCTTNLNLGFSSVQGAPVFAALSVGSFHACGITDSGEAYCWGRNYYGALGNPDAGEWPDTAVKVVTDTPYVEIAAAADYTCARTAGGDVYCWGLNNLGQLGDSTFVDRETPVKVRTEQVFSTLQAQGWTTCGTETSGDRYCWGGAIMVESSEDCGGHRCTPYPVRGLGGPYERFDIGAYHVCGFLGNGLLECIGRSSSGQLGSSSGGRVEGQWDP